jgi:hypothetical protein
LHFACWGQCLPYDRRIFSCGCATVKIEEKTKGTQKRDEQATKIFGNDIEALVRTLLPAFYKNKRENEN